MSYFTPTGAVVDKIGSALKEGLDFYGQMQADKATADLARSQAAAAASGGQSSSSGFPVMPIVLLGGVGLAAWLLLRKKRA
jgi:hypothetical protein